MSKCYPFELLNYWELREWERNIWNKKKKRDGTWSERRILCFVTAGWDNPCYRVISIGWFKKLRDPPASCEGQHLIYLIVFFFLQTNKIWKTKNAQHSHKVKIDGSVFIDDHGWKVCGEYLGIAEKCNPGDPKEEQFWSELWGALSECVHHGSPQVWWKIIHWIEGSRDATLGEQSSRGCTRVASQ